MTKIFYHADDFGVTIEQSRSILDCYESGVLNSVSIIPNSDHMSESYELIKMQVNNNLIRLVIHLNFVEGRCMANKAEVPHLIDENGMLKCTYGSMLKYNFSKKHELLKKEFVAEIEAQIRAVVELTGTKEISVDSHQHYLQIPMIWEAFVEVVKRNDYVVRYIRIPVDPVSPILSTPNLFFNVPVINHVKYFLLKMLSPSKHDLRGLGAKVPVFMGMPFTCQMTYDRVQRLLPHYIKVAEKKERDLEIMFHPGAVRNTAELMDSSQLDLVDFYSSHYRDLEKETLMKLRNS